MGQIIKSSIFNQFFFVSRAKVPRTISSWGDILVTPLPICYSKTKDGDDLKKILFTVGFIVFVFGSLFVLCLGFYSFFNNINPTHNMQTVKVSIADIEELDGRNPSLYLYSSDSNFIYEVPSVWYSKFNIDTFNDSFIPGKEYTITVDDNEIENDTDVNVISVYGMADEYQDYLLLEDAISSDKSNSILGLIIGLAMLGGITVLVVLILLNRKSVLAFLKEFYGRK